MGSLNDRGIDILRTSASGSNPRSLTLRGLIIRRTRCSSTRGAPIEVTTISRLANSLPKRGVRLAKDAPASSGEPAGASNPTAAAKTVRGKTAKATKKKR